MGPEATAQTGGRSGVPGKLSAAIFYATLTLLFAYPLSCSPGTSALFTNPMTFTDLALVEKIAPVFDLINNQILETLTM